MSNKLIIAFEGIEGSGKSLHLKNVAAAAHKIMHPEITKEEEVAKEEPTTVEPTTTEQEKTNG